MAVTISLVACGNQEKQQHSELSRVALPDSAALSQAKNSDPPRIASLDSAALSAPEDSILDAGISNEGVLPNGDTVRGLGGSMMDAGASEVYGIRHYIKNGTHYLRIQRIVGRNPDGNPVWLIKARLRLPRMDSTDVVTEAFCEINGKPDHSILGLTSTFGDSVDYHARRAWRFDRATETLREIPAAGVTCSPITGDPD